MNDSGASEPAIITCALNGVLTDPAQHPVPVTPEQMARSAREAYDAGATVMHIHFREQSRGTASSWEPELAWACTQAIRDACPGVLVNMTTGVLGRDVSGPLACLRRVRPEMAACNAGSLNYLKTRADGSWAWKPMVFDNPVEKVAEMLEAMRETGTRPELECFDVGIVRSVGLYVDNGLTERPYYNFVMGVASGMPADVELLPLLVRYKKPDCAWQVTAIGRAEVWALHQRAAELGGNLRTGLEDTFYLPSGERATSNGQLIEALVKCARAAGREIASADEARRRL